VGLRAKLPKVFGAYEKILAFPSTSRPPKLQ
jgi:hypothetical protein